MGLAFFNQDSHVAVRTIPESGRVEKIPAHVYRIAMSKEGLDLPKDRAKFTMPGKIFGKHRVYRNAIMESFDEKDGTTGVLLNGLKGAGKSMLAEDICNQAIKRGMPVLMIDKPIPVEALRGILKIIGPCCLYFDEFGKIYTDKNDRAQMLTLFSDTSLKQVLFVLTSNETDELNEYMINRPGRFEFYINYGDIPADTVKEVLKHFNITGDMYDMLLGYCYQHTLSFDILMYLMKAASRSTTVADFNERIAILNVPDPVYRHLNAAQVSFKGKPFVGECIVRNIDHGFEFDLMDKETMEMVSSGIVDLQVNEKILIDQTGATKNWRVVANTDVVMKVSESWYKQVQKTKNRLIAKANESGESSMEGER